MAHFNSYLKAYIYTGFRISENRPKKKNFYSYSKIPPEATKARAAVSIISDWTCIIEK